MRVALDIETNLAHDTIHLVVTKNLDTGEVKVWKNPNGLNDYLSKATRLIAHNGISFDFYHLNRLWNTKIGLKKTYDTLVASRLLEPTRESGHSLESYGKQSGTQKIDYAAVWSWMMDRREEYPGECFDNPIDSLLVHYCIRDVDVLEKTYEFLTKELEKKEFSPESLELEHQVAAIIAQQERNGFKLDTIHATCLLTDLKTKMAEIYEQMQERWPPVTLERFSEKTGKRLKDEIITFNPGSRKQIGEKLIELGWKPQKLTPTGQPLVDEDTLRGVLFPEGQIIADYFLLQKRIAQIESWLEAMGPDGRVHGKVITNGAVTGRATHSKPNMAQVPATKKDKDGNILYGIEGGYGVESRKCWTVETGNVLVGIDLSGIELRCFAHYLNDPEYTNEVVNGDVHTKNQKAFGVATRSEAKTVLYASLYGASASKIGRIVGGTEQTGKGILDSFRRNVPAFAELQKKVSRYAAKGWLPGLDGRRLLVRSEHSALNTLLQSAGAIIAKRWIVETTKKLNEAKIPYKLVAWVHDELQIETSQGHASTVGRIAVEAAERAGIFLNFRCPVAAEWKSGNNWFDCH